MTQFAAASNDLLRVIQREMGGEENNDEEGRLHWLGQIQRVHHQVPETPGHDGEGLVAGEGLGSVENLESEDMDSQDQGTPLALDYGNGSGLKRPGEGGWGGARKAWAVDASKWRWRAQRTAWPHWVYSQFDAYELARRAAGKCWNHEAFFVLYCVSAGWSVFPFWNLVST